MFVGDEDIRFHEGLGSRWRRRHGIDPASGGRLPAPRAGRAVDQWRKYGSSDSRLNAASAGVDVSTRNG
jgi:hypothetical protein